MTRRRWAFGAAAAAGVVALLAPAVGQGKAESASLWWARSHGGPAVTSYDFGARDGGSNVSSGFRLASSSVTKSGTLAIWVSGSSRFSITSDKCRRKKEGIGKNLSCWVGVTYAPRGAGTSDSATLWAKSASGDIANLSLSGSSTGPAGHVYWSNFYGYAVNSVPRGGGRVTSFGGGGYPMSLAVTSTDVYWVSVGTATTGTVNKVPLGGGTVSTLATGQNYPWSVATDGTNVYWVDGGPYSAGTVNEVPVGGGPVTTLATGQDNPYSVAVDGTHVYWVNWAQQGTVNEVPIGGGQVTTLATGQSYPSAVAVDGTHVYWVDSAYNCRCQGTVNKVPVGGGPVTTLATGQIYPSSIAVDGAYVYWTDELGGTVDKIPLGGGAVTTLASNQAQPAAVAVDGTHAYWTNYVPYVVGLDLASVAKVRLSGGSVVALATGQAYADSIAVGP